MISRSQKPRLVMPGVQSRSPATKEQGASPQVLGEGRRPKGWVVQKTSPSRQSMPREPVLSFHISGGKKGFLLIKEKGLKYLPCLFLYSGFSFLLSLMVCIKVQPLTGRSTQCSVPS